LLSHLEKSVTQDQVVRAAQVCSTIKDRGARPSQLAKAVAKLAPKFKFWFKQDATIDDLVTLIHQYQWPVGVNWQGLFYDSIDDEPKGSDGDFGHYSVIIDIDPQKDEIVIADPYPEYSSQPRIFSLQWFVSRWWDNVNDKEKNGHHTILNTHYFMFVIVPIKEKFPLELGMLPATQLSILEQKPWYLRAWKKFQKLR